VGTLDEKNDCIGIFNKTEQDLPVCAEEALAKTFQADKSLLLLSHRCSRETDIFTLLI
jgi:hypothetical protein